MRGHRNLNLMFIIDHLAQHVSGIIMPIVRRTRLCTTTYGVQHWLCWLWSCGAGSKTLCTLRYLSRPTTFTQCSSTRPQPAKQCWTPYAVVHSFVLLTMGIMMPETCWGKRSIINTRSVASCWFLSPPCPCYIRYHHILKSSRDRRSLQQIGPNFRPVSQKFLSVPFLLSSQFCL